MTSTGEAQMLPRKYYRFVKRLLVIFLIFILSFLGLSWLHVGSNVVNQENFRNLEVLNNVPKGSNDFDHGQSKTRGEKCPIPDLKQGAKWPAQLSPLSKVHPVCKRLEPVPGSCAIASELFFQTGVNCNHQTPLKICEIKVG